MERPGMANCIRLAPAAVRLDFLFIHFLFSFVDSEEPQSETDQGDERDTANSASDDCAHRCLRAATATITITITDVVVRVWWI